MSQEFIQCPHCGQSIELSRAISRDLEERLRSEYETALGKEREHFAAAAKALEKKRQEDLALARCQFETETRQKLTDEVRAEVDGIREDLQRKDKRLRDAEQKELQLRREKLALEEKEKGLELELARRLDEERKRIEERASQEAEDRQRLKLAEKDHQIESMRRHIDDLRRQAEQGSQQSQGEVLEVELEALLRREFPFDSIEAVAKGTRGGDILQSVLTQSGRECGKILWETKRTKHWSPSWIQKLKDDQRDAKASIAVLVSESLPEGMHHFRQIDGIWVTDIPSALSLALALRVILIQVARTRETEIGRQEKMEALYLYLTGPEFKNRVEAILETFRSLQEELESEKRAMQRIWDRRAKHIERVVASTSGMYGDLEGLSGQALPSIKLLDLGAAKDSTIP